MRLGNLEVPDLQAWLQAHRKRWEELQQMYEPEIVALFLEVFYDCKALADALEEVNVDCTIHDEPALRTPVLDAKRWNDQHSVGAPVRYWIGTRSGGSRVGVTRSLAQVLGGHTAVVWVEKHSGCLALTHVEAISQKEFLDWLDKALKEEKK